MKQQKKPTKFDEEGHYCMSLAARLRKLYPQKKDFARSTIEKLLFDLEYGYTGLKAQNNTAFSSNVFANAFYSTPEVERPRSCQFGESSPITYQQL